jgi:hypothetical protein
MVKIYIPGEHLVNKLCYIIRVDDYFILLT